jgi:hypothetical protein
MREPKKGGTRAENEKTAIKSKNATRRNHAQSTKKPKKATRNRQQATEPPNMPGLGNHHLTILYHLKNASMSLDEFR